MDRISRTLRTVVRRAAALAAGVVVSCAKAPAPAARPPAPDPGPRYPRPEEVLILPEPGPTPLTLGSPAYPTWWGRRADAQPAVAMVIDASGRVELRSVAFVHPAPEAFYRTICEHLARSRYTTAYVDNEPRRSLILEAYAFSKSDKGPPPVDLNAIGEHFRTIDRAALFAELEALPHCPER